MTDIVEFIRARLAEDEATARSVKPLCHTDALGGLRIDHRFTVTRLVASGEDGSYRSEADQAAAAHFHRHDPARVLREVEANRRILAEHKPRLETVEWPHDQTGDGHGWTCPRCQNVENDASDWHPPVGAAGEFPKDDFVTPYVLAPCLTLAVLASVWSGHPDYRTEWAPA